MMKLAVCEAPAELPADSNVWTAFAETARKVTTDFFLLNEMPFGSWIAARAVLDPEVLVSSHRAHLAGIRKLPELGAPVVISTFPTFEAGVSVNQGFIWEQEGRV